jgi:hypothetical protein
VDLDIRVLMEERRKGEAVSSQDDTSQWKCQRMTMFTYFKIVNDDVKRICYNVYAFMFYHLL